MKIPAGESLGREISEVTVAELEAACEKVEAELCSVRQNTYKARKSREFVAAARRMLAQRKFPTGSYETTADANRALRDAAEVGWLVAPSDQVARVLDGTAIVISAFRVDVPLDTFASDDEPGMRVPGKPLLDRIANALGVSWNPSQRTDNQSSPYLRACVIGGLVREFDGSQRGIEGHAEIDLNNGSALQKAIVARCQDRVRGRIELERRRQFILSHADTTARLRAIKQIGLRDRYSPTELSKPFFIARSVFTAVTDDPIMKASFTHRIADNFLGASSVLYPKRTAV